MIQMVTIDEDNTGMVNLVQLEEKLKVYILVVILKFLCVWLNHRCIHKLMMQLRLEYSVPHLTLLVF